MLGLQLSPLLDLSIDGQRSRRAPELPDSNRLPDVRSAQEISVEVRRSKTLVGEISVGVRRSKTLVREISVGVRRSKTLVGEISVGVRRSKTLVGEISVGVQRSKTLVGEISVGVRRLKAPALGLIANLTRLPCASATALGIVDPQILFGVYLEAGVTIISQRRTVHHVGRHPSDGRDAFTFQIRRDGIPLDGR